MTYAEEKKAKDAEHARKSKKFRYDPVLFDRTQVDYVTEGQTVVKVQPFGCPRNGTMGMCYVADGETGAFLGMVCMKSLKPLKGAKQ